MKQISWSDSEIETVRRLHAMGRTTVQIARELPWRTRGAVQVRLNSLGLLANPPVPDTSLIETDRATVAKAAKSGMTDRRIQAKFLPHRSVTWIEIQRRSLGFKRKRSNGPSLPGLPEETEVQLARRLRQSSETLLEALSANHTAGVAECSFRSGTLRVIPRATPAFSGITSFGNLCADEARP